MTLDLWLNTGDSTCADDEDSCERLSCPLVPYGDYGRKLINGGSNVNSWDVSFVVPLVRTRMHE